MALLLVEDDTIVRLTLCDCLEDTGLKILDAGDATTALAILKRPVNCINILVTDLNLGPGDNGLVIAKKARRFIPGLRVIYTTGSPEMLKGRQMRPWERLFTKPFDIWRLRDDLVVLDQALRSTHAMDLPRLVSRPAD